MKPAIYPLSETSLDIEKDTFFTFWNTTGTLTPGNFFLSFSNSVFRGTPNTPLSNGQEDKQSYSECSERQFIHPLVQGFTNGAFSAAK